MKNILFIFAFTFIALPVFAQTTNTTTTTSNTGTTNATVTSPGNVVVSTPNGTIGNQVNTPANTNNVYVVTPNNSVNGSANDNDRNRRYGRDQRDNDRRDYDRAQSQHDYRDRSNYYNIRRNQQIEVQGGTNELSRRNHQSDYHSSYPSYFGNDHRSHRRD